MTSPLDRLARIEADPTLRHTGARWRAHEAAYPGSGGAERARLYAETDAVKLAEVEASLAEVEGQFPDDEAVAYLRWLRDELSGAAS